ncbi:anion permease [Desulfomarina profundi]|uniref:Anion permease n=1 Tax=Desulfomarina profundi TaxID=2772557 RepID=A0A8D5FN97_9BACT|nr:inorganic phosphate transporter [Desulfomarina profundi]BCL62258.1 anion permease [Desulfomarina profundi]
MLSLLGGVFLGWSLGANDASNIIGTAVSSKMMRFWPAALLASFFVIVGAVISGQAGIETLKGLTTLSVHQAVITSIAAAVTVTIMTVMALPVSTSQSVVGAILGMGILNNQLNFSGLGKVVLCWVGTPVGAAIIAVLLYRIMGFFYNRIPMTLFNSDHILRLGLILSASYGAYALGANNVANVTGVFVGAGMISVLTAAIIGGISIAFGILTFSRPVMETVGKKIVTLEPFSALVVSLALAMTIHLYTLVGVPVSSSQAVIGGVMGIGIVKGVNTVDISVLKRIFLAWIFTPVVACSVALLISYASRLRYIPL